MGDHIIQVKFVVSNSKNTQGISMQSYSISNLISLLKKRSVELICGFGYDAVISVFENNQLTKLQLEAFFQQQKNFLNVS